MQPETLVGAGIVLVGTIAVGVVAHELAHALTLGSFGVPLDIQWLPDGGQSARGGGQLSGRWAAVTPRRIPRTVPTWGIKLSALAPFLLTLPVLLVVAGFPSPLLTENPYVVAVTVGWLACSLPSPQDFSVFWYTESVVAELREDPAVDR